MPEKEIHVSRIVGEPDEHIIDARVQDQGGSFVLVAQFIEEQNP